jgi:hypothetical protein
MPSPEDAWDAAFHWLCIRRMNAPFNADVWDVRFHWPHNRELIYQKVQRGDYRLSPMQIVGHTNNQLAMWCALDALVLKWVAIQIQGRLPHHSHCEHGPGHQGGRMSLHRVQMALCDGEFSFVFRTDIRGYYQHIRKEQI